LTLTIGAILIVPLLTPEVTVNGTLKVVLIPPPSALTSAVAAPTIAALEAVSVRVAAPPVVASGLIAAVTPVGSSIAASATGELNPPVRRIETVALLFEPWLKVRLGGDKESENDPVGGEVTTSGS
jgi:hypothetical protein